MAWLTSWVVIWQHLNRAHSVEWLCKICIWTRYRNLNLDYLLWPLNETWQSIMIGINNMTLLNVLEFRWMLLFNNYIVPCHNSPVPCHNSTMPCHNSAMPCHNSAILCLSPCFSWQHFSTPQSVAATYLYSKSTICGYLNLISQNIYK